MRQLDVDTEKGGVKVNNNFLVDLGLDLLWPMKCGSQVVTAHQTYGYKDVLFHMLDRVPCPLQSKRKAMS